MRFYDIISNLKFMGIKNYKEMEIESLSCNTIEENKNGIYFCLKGMNADGHKFAKSAIEKGAVCLVVEKYLDLPATQILVENSRLAMSAISAKFYETENSQMKFVGITGTNGKTTTSFIIKDILKAMGKSVGLIGTEGIYINNEILPNNMTTPDPINLHKIINQMAKSTWQIIWVRL